MKTKKIILFSFILAFFSVFLLFAEEMTLQEQKIDWNTELWQNFVQTKDFDFYKQGIEQKISEFNALNDVQKSDSDEIIKTKYNTLVSEAFFYVAFVSKEFLTNTESNKIIYDFVSDALENQNQYTASALGYFVYMAKTGFFSRYGLGKTLFELNIVQKKDFEIDPSLPSGIDERIALLRAIAELEALNSRFIAAQSQNEDELRFSDEAFIKTTQKPVLNYVLKNEPSFKTLYESYLVAKENIGSMSFGALADSYYLLEQELSVIKDFITKYSVSTKDVVSPYTDQFIKMYYSNPFVLTQLNLQQLDFLRADLAFLTQIEVFAPRFVDFLKKAE